MKDCRNMSQIFSLDARHTISGRKKSTLYQIDPLRVASASAIERSRSPASQKNTFSAKGLDHIGGDLVAHEQRGAESKPLPRRGGRGRGADTGAGGLSGRGRFGAAPGWMSPALNSSRRSFGRPDAQIRRRPAGSDPLSNAAVENDPL